MTFLKIIILPTRPLDKNQLKEKLLVNTGKNKRLQGRLGGYVRYASDLDFGSGHDLTVCGIHPTWGSELTVWSLLGIRSLPLSAPPPPVLMLALSKNK